MMVDRRKGAGPLPDFPGWRTPRFGFESGPDHMVMEYQAKRVPAPVQTSIFDLLGAADQEDTNQ